MLTRTCLQFKWATRFCPGHWLSGISMLMAIEMLPKQGLNSVLSPLKNQLYGHTHTVSVPCRVPLMPRASFGGCKTCVGFA